MGARVGTVWLAVPPSIVLALLAFVNGSLAFEKLGTYVRMPVDLETDMRMKLCGGVCFDICCALVHIYLAFASAVLRRLT